MTPAKLAALIRYKTKTNSTTFADADMLPLVNIFKDEISEKIAQTSSSMFIVPALDDLVADQREYAWPSDVLNHLIDVEVAFATASPLDYIKIDAIKRKDFTDALTEARITNAYSNNAGGAAYFKRRRSIYILSGTISNVTNGLRLTYRAYPADLANLTEASTDMATDPTTTTFGFPRGFHELLARRVSMEWKQSRPKPIPLSRLELNYENDLDKALKAVNREDENEEIVNELPDEAQVGRPMDNGYNL